MRGGTKTIRTFVLECSFLRLTEAFPLSPSASTSESGLLPRMALWVWCGELWALYLVGEVTARMGYLPAVNYLQIISLGDFQFPNIPASKPVESFSDIIYPWKNVRFIFIWICLDLAL